MTRTKLHDAMGDWEHRLWHGVEFTETCWVWKRAVDGRGYGGLSINGKMYKVHRCSYELIIGCIPQGLVIDHLCRNRLCVNPWHMEPVTSVANVMRGFSMPAQYARSTQCRHGHPYDEQNTRYDQHGHKICLACRRRSAGAERQAVTA